MLWYLICTGAVQWAVVMSKGTKYVRQVIEMDFQYPSEGIHYNWDKGACTPVALVFRLAVSAWRDLVPHTVSVGHHSPRRPL